MPNPYSVTYVHHRLSNGLQLVVSPDRVAPVVALSLWYDVGSRHERPGRTGFAHLFEHLMFEGSTNVASGEHMRAIEEAGGNVNATTSTERTNYVQTVPIEQLELVLWFEADRMSGLLDAVSQEALDKQRDVVKNERRQRYDNQPYGVAFERATELLFPVTHPYHHTPIGSMDDLDAASLEDVQEFFRSHYGPENAVLTLVGDIDPDEALELVTKHFSHVSGRSPTPAPEGVLDEPVPAGTRVVLREKVPLPALYRAYRFPPADDPDLDGLEVAVAVLTAGRAGVLQQRLVRRELAQGIGAVVDARVAGSSVCFVVATARRGVALDAIEAVIQEEISRLADEGPSSSELDRARALIERSSLDHLARLEGRADALSRCTTLYGDPGRVNERLPRLLQVSADDVRTVVRKYLVERHPVVVEYQPLTEEVAA